MEEEEVNRTMETSSGKLNLDAPLLSTKRPSGLTIKICRMDSFRESVDSSDRVPFSWEHTPGRPKNFIRNMDPADQDIALKPLPKPPPIRWYYPRDSSCFEVRDDDDEYRGGTDVDRNHDYGHSDDDAEDDEYDDKDEEALSFSDAIDLFTLAETSTNTEAGAGRVQGSAEGLSVDDDGVGGGNDGWSSIMMERFLPDAAALAALSSSPLDAAATAKDLGEEHLSSIYSCDSSRGGCPRRRGDGREFTSLKGCGLDIFFPWRAKHKLCGVKSPVRIGCYDLKPQSSPRDKY